MTCYLCAGDAGGQNSLRKIGANAEAPMCKTCVSRWMPKEPACVELVRQSVTVEPHPGRDAFMDAWAWDDATGVFRGVP